MTDENVYLSYLVDSVKKKHHRHRHRYAGMDGERSAVEIVARIHAEQIDKNPPASHRAEDDGQVI